MTSIRRRILPPVCGLNDRMVNQHAGSASRNAVWHNVRRFVFFRMNNADATVQLFPAGGDPVGCKRLAATRGGGCAGQSAFLAWAVPAAGRLVESWDSYLAGEVAWCTSQLLRQAFLNCLSYDNYYAHLMATSSDFSVGTGWRCYVTVLC